MARRHGLLIFALLLLSYAYFIYRGPQWNADSRLDLTFALIDQKTLAIDAYHENTQDKAYFSGHYYTDKAPGMSLIAAPLYALLRTAMPELFQGELGFVGRQLLTLIVVSLPAAAFGVLLYTFLGEFLPEASSRFALVLAYGLGTIAYPFSTVFYSHHLTAITLFTAFFLLYRRPWREPWPALLAGFLAGFAILTEYPAAIGAILLGLYSIVKSWTQQERVSNVLVREAAPFVIGALPPLLIAGGYNWLAFGNLLQTGYSHLAGEPSFITGMSQGLLGLTAPTLASLWGTTLSPYRGLFFLSPFLLLAIPGYIRWWQMRRLRWELALSAAMFGSYFLLNASYFAWEGGYSLGPRHLLPGLPFLLWAVAFAIPRWKAVFYGLALLSIAHVVVATATVALPPPEVTNPLLELQLPHLLSGQVNNNWAMLFGIDGFASLLPLLLLLALGIGWGLLKASLGQRELAPDKSSVGPKVKARS